MQSSRALEIWVGVFVVLAVAALFGLAMRVSNLNDFQRGEGYDVSAFFQNIGGLKEKAPVTLAGVPVGRVKSIVLDEQSFQAKVTLTIRADIDRLPDDTSASILTSGLLGEQYVGLEPGGSDASLKAGDTIDFTQSALVLEKIIGQFLFSKAAGE